MANRHWSKTVCMSERSSKALRGTSMGSISGRGTTPILEHCGLSEPFTFGTWDEMGAFGTLDRSGQATGDVACEEGGSQATLAR